MLFALCSHIVEPIRLPVLRKRSLEASTPLTWPLTFQLPLP